MSDAVPIRTSDGSFITFSALPVGPERIMRWVDRLPATNLEAFDVIRWVEQIVEYLSHADHS